LDALGYLLLEEAAKVGRVKGLPMPMGRQLRNSNWADDLALFPFIEESII